MTVEGRLCACGCGKTTRKEYAPSHHPNCHLIKRLHPEGMPWFLYYRDGSPRYSVDDRTGCWNWMGSKSSNGYGTTAVRTGKGSPGRGAHVAHWEFKRGPLPKGLQLDHLCRNRLCINLDHLEMVTCRENIRRSPRTKLTAESVREIRGLYASGHTQLWIAQRYGICAAYVSQLCSSRTTRWVLDRQEEKASK